MECKIISLTDMSSEKHAKKEEALAKLREGVKFDQVAREYSEDKAKQGELSMHHYMNSTHD